MGKAKGFGRALTNAPIREALEPVEEFMTRLLGVAKQHDMPVRGAVSNSGTLDPISNVSAYSHTARNNAVLREQNWSREGVEQTAADERLLDIRTDERVSSSPGERRRIKQESAKRDEGITKSRQDANRRIDEGKSPNAYDRIRRGLQGTPTETVERRAKEWAKNHADPRIRERLITMAGYESRITPTADAKGLYPEWLGQAPKKGTNKLIKENQGLEYTVEQHHLIALRDSALLGKEIDKLDSPYHAVAIYDYMLEKFGILPGNFDLNVANIAAGPHRLKIGGDLHTWLDRLGYEDYWLDFSKRWANDTPSVTEILDAFDLYMDEVFYPMMIKLDDLVKNNPTKGDFQGAYIPKYLVDQAYARIKELNKTWDIPRKSRGGTVSIEDQRHQIAADQGLDERGVYRQESIGDTGILATSRRHFVDTDKKVTAKKRRKLQIQDKKRVISDSTSL